MSPTSTGRGRERQSRRRRGFCNLMICDEVLTEVTEQYEEEKKKTEEIRKICEKLMKKEKEEE